MVVQGEVVGGCCGGELEVKRRRFRKGEIEKKKKKKEKRKKKKKKKKTNRDIGGITRRSMNFSFFLRRR